MSQKTSPRKATKTERTVPKKSGRTFLAGLELPPNWHNDAAWVHSVLFLKANQEAMQRDLGDIDLGRAAKVLVRSIRRQWDIAGTLLERSLGRDVARSLGRELAHVVHAALDEGNPGVENAMPSPQSGGGADPSEGWGVPSYA
jgi:hypothetical protein